MINSTVKYEWFFETSNPSDRFLSVPVTSFQVICPSRQVYVEAAHVEICCFSELFGFFRGVGVIVRTYTRHISHVNDLTRSSPSIFMRLFLAILTCAFIICLTAENEQFPSSKHEVALLPATGPKQRFRRFFQQVTLPFLQHRRSFRLLPIQCGLPHQINSQRTCHNTWPPLQYFNRICSSQPFLLLEFRRNLPHSNRDAFGAVVFAEAADTNGL